MSWKSEKSSISSAKNRDESQISRLCLYVEFRPKMKKKMIMMIGLKCKRDCQKGGRGGGKERVLGVE
jgi:hypothetical protein